MKIYHFCAMFPGTRGNLHYVDGTLTTDACLSDPKNYNKLKEEIGESANPPHTGAETILLQLSIIGETP